MLTEPSAAADRPAVAVQRATADSRSRSSRWIVIIALLPIALAAAASLYATSLSLAYRLRMPYIQNPWESAIIVDAYRAAHGQEVYEPVKRGHATHLYGPLMSQTLGTIFRVTGPSLYTGRIINLASSLIVCALLIAIFCQRRPLTLFVAAALMLALHYRARAYFVETRPDMTAFLLAMLAICCLYRAHRDGTARAMWYAPGIALIWLAFLFKQTYAAAAGVPLIALVLTRQISDRRALLCSLLPLAAMAALLAFMKFVTPVVFFYTWTVPKMYPVTLPRLALATVELVTLSPLFVAFAGWWLIGRHPAAKVEREMSPPIMWLLAAAVVGAAAGIPAYAKRGGSYNSLLLGWIPMTAFCVAMLGPVLTRIIEFAKPGDERVRPALGPGLTCIVGGWFVALLVLAMNFAVPKSDFWKGHGAHGGPEYWSVVAAARDLPGRVVAPDDPTITMFARNEVGRNLEAELDATGRTTLTPGLLEEIRKARWIICVHADFDDKRFSPEVMHDLGFRRVKQAPFERAYSLWKRVEQPTTNG